MEIVGSIIHVLLFTFIALLWIRFVVDWVQVFARSWSPRGVLLVILEVVVGVQQADDGAAVGRGEEDEHARHDQHEAAMAVGQARERVEHQLALIDSCQAATTGFSPAIAPRSIAVTMFRCIPYAKKRQTSSGGAPDSSDTTLMTSPYLRRTWSRISGSETAT